MPRNPVLGLKLITRARQILDIHKERSSIVVASTYMKSVLLYNGFESDKIRVIPYFTKLPESNNQRLHKNLPNILFIGRLVKEKGVGELLHALSKVKNESKLTVVGEGPELPYLKKLAAELGMSSRVDFLGWVDHEKLNKHFGETTLVVIPSIWPEPFGIVGIEAMAHKIPVVAFEGGGITDWLNNGQTGLLVKNQDEDELAKKINSLLDCRQTRDRMGKIGLKVVKKQFLASRHLDKLESAFKSVNAQRSNL
jgi:glycosyltransferase involved in cell wall biosynthesis